MITVTDEEFITVKFEDGYVRKLRHHQVAVEKVSRIRLVGQ